MRAYAVSRQIVVTLVVSVRIRFVDLLSNKSLSIVSGYEDLSDDEKLYLWLLAKGECCVQMLSSLDEICTYLLNDKR